jgi:hypothetical protein
VSRTAVRKLEGVVLSDSIVVMCSVHLCAPLVEIFLNPTDSFPPLSTRVAQFWHSRTVDITSGAFILRSYHVDVRTVDERRRLSFKHHYVALLLL